MSKLPRVSGVELIKALKVIGFLPVRTRGDHVILQDKDGRMIPVPLVDTIGPGLMSDIMNELGISRPDFVRLLQNPKRWRKEHEARAK